VSLQVLTFLDPPLHPVHRCAFDLWKGDLLVDDPGWDDLPRIACPTCATTYGMVTGKKGPPLKRTGLAGFVGNLAKTATVDASSKDAKAYIITRDDDGRTTICVVLMLSVLGLYTSV
jgi:hypothetical protein